VMPSTRQTGTARKVYVEQRLLHGALPICERFPTSSVT
jgi:hypothetical protein